MASYLDFEGVYDKVSRYIVRNWSEEDFYQHFGEESVYNENNIIVVRPAYDMLIKAGEAKEMGQFEAYMCTKNLVTREMLRPAIGLSGKEAERIEMAVNNKDARKPFEDKTLQKVDAGTESLFMQEMREKIRLEELEKIKAMHTPVIPVEVKIENEPVTDAGSTPEFAI